MDDQKLQGAILGHSNDLRDFPFSRFRALASEVSADAAAQAAELEIHITWLTNLFSEIRSAPRSRNPRSVNEPLGSPGISNGYDWKDFPKRDYETHWRFAHGPLQKLLNQLDTAERLTSLPSR